jgi:centromeric protein E
VANEKVYETLGRSIVDKFLDGYNGTILTFGQTSSGKTHTMVGNQKTTGIIEMAIDDIMKTVKNDVKFRVGYVEIYNEKIMDLLDGKNSDLKLYERKGIILTNQKQIEVNSKEEIMKIFHRGNQAKRMGESITNENSSRSHTIFSINLESVAENGRKISSNLFLVDLAGSEKPDMSKGSFNEGLFINKSLLALGKIVRLLSEKIVNSKKLRFRDSLLTRLLSPALGGNSYTSMICTLSPTSVDETFHTIW